MAAVPLANPVPGALDGAVGSGDADVAAADGTALPSGSAERVPPGLSCAVGSAAADALASARFTASGVSSRPPVPVIPWPSTETASRLPPVAVAAPSSHAATPMRTRVCTFAACRPFS